MKTKSLSNFELDNSIIVYTHNAVFCPPDLVDLLVD